MGQQRDPRACLYGTLNDPSLTSFISTPQVMASERSRELHKRVSPCAESTDDEDDYVKIPDPSGEPRSSEIESPKVSNPLEGAHTLDPANVCDGGVCSATSVCSKAIFQQSEGQPDPYAPPSAKGPEIPSTHTAEAILQGENAEAMASAKREELERKARAALHHHYRFNPPSIFHISAGYEHVLPNWDPRRKKDNGQKKPS